MREREREGGGGGGGGGLYVLSSLASYLHVNTHYGICYHDVGFAIHVLQL